MANTRIKDLSNTATNVASDAFIAIDGSANGTEKISRDNLRQDTADALAAAPSTYNLAPLTSGSVDVDKGGTGSTTVAGAKANLEIPTLGTAANEVPVNGMLGDLAFQSSAGVVVDDLTVDGQLTAAVGKPMPVNGPSMRFDGASYVDFADNDAFSFTNGTDDTSFSVSAWVKMADAQYFVILSKNGSTNSLKEWFLWTDQYNVLQFWLRDTSGNYVIIPAAGNLNDYVNEWTHISVSYGGAGPASSVGFENADSTVNFYINGKIATKGTATYSGTYLGMSATAQPLKIGEVGGVYAEGEIRDVKLFNKELSAAEVREVYSNGQLPESFAESTGTIAYVSDFTGDANSFTAVNGTVAHSTSVGGQSNVLRLTVDTSTGAHYLQKQTVFSRGKRYRVQGRFYVPTNSHVDGIYIVCGTSGAVQIIRESAPTLNAWNDFDVEITADATGDSDRLLVYALDGNSTTVTDPSGDDVLYIDNIRITQIGSVLDARAENYNQSAGKLLDVSGNDFVGTQSGGVTLLTPRSHLSAGTLDLTNLPTSASGLSAGEVYNDSGILKIV